MYEQLVTLLKTISCSSCNSGQFVTGYSPDMNPIENLWGIVKKRLKKIDITTKVQLIENLIQIWHLLLLLLLIKRYNLFKVLACSTTFFHPSLSWARFLQFRRFMPFISSETSSSQRNVGLPFGLLDMGFHLLIFFTLLSSVMRSTWPNHFNLCFATPLHAQKH